MVGTRVLGRHGENRVQRTPQRVSYALKKENQQFKKRGQVDESESDPICAPLYKEIAGCAVRKGFIQAWVFTVLQWNLMARSQNVDGLTWNCFSLAKDSISIKFWDTKKDKKGEKCTPKHCFSNPFDYRICVTTSLAAYLSIYNQSRRMHLTTAP